MTCDACGHTFPRGGALVLQQMRRTGMRSRDDPAVIRCPHCKDGPVRFTPPPDETVTIKLDN